MACSDIITCTAKQCFSKLLGIVVTMTLKFVWMSDRCMHINTGWLPRHIGPNYSHVVRLGDNN